MKEFEYRIVNNEYVEIIGTKNNSKKIIIPETIEGLKVTHIGDWAFRNNQLTSIDLKQVTHILNE